MIRTCVAAIAASAVAASANADMVSLVANRDAAMYESASVEFGNGAGQFVFCGRTGNSLARRSVMSFDLSGLSAGVIVTSATLTLHLSQGQSITTSVSLHRALASWTEGPTDPPENEGGGAPAAPGDVTWNFRSLGGDPWANAGGDFADLASATSSIGADFDFYQWSSAGLVADVQAWIDGGSSNDGWLIRGDESGPSTSKRFDSRENPEASFRPMLTIEYIVPSPCGVLVLLGTLRSSRRRYDH